MKRLYGFRDDEWDPRFILHPPPVLLDYSNQPTRSIVPDAETAIIFGSKLQRIKNPATFIRGCVGFLRTSREFRGTVRLLAHDFDGFYADQIKALVPTDLSSRITFSPGAPDRNESIAQGISVLSSDFESYCLAAYEASLLGGIVVLNNSNPAFGNNTAWIDGVNCIKYDGSALSLVAALRRAATLCAPLDIVRIPTTPAPWRHARPGIRSSPIESPLVSIVIPHHNLQDFLLDAIESCLVQDYPNLEIIVVDDCSSEIKSEKVLALLELSCIENLTICRLPTNVGLSDARNIGIAESKGKYIVTLDADDMINKEFVKWGVGCLERNATIDIVVPNARCFVEDPTTAVSTPFASSGYYAFLGEAFCSGFSVNSFGTSCAMFRSDLFYEIEYDETMEALEDWTLYINAVNANKRCAVMNQAAFYYRHRANSLSAGFNDPKWFEVCAAKVKRMASRTPPRLPIQFLALRGPESSGPHHQGTTPGPTYAELEALRKEAAEARTDAAYISGHLQARSAMLGALIGIYRAEFNVNNEATVRELIKIFGFFDPSWYRANYPELIGTDDKLFEHFITVGLIEQRMPNSHFNPEVYLARYPDVRASGMPAVVHYLLYGAGEGRTF
nr:glycosyltransferase family 2 protein [Prosthecomicrobium hirschii]